MKLIRFAYAALGICLAGLIVYAIRSGDFWTEGNWLTSNPWGIVTLADLYLGLLISAGLIAVFERTWTALLWIIPLPFLGNVWTVVWFVMRFPELRRRLRG